MTYRSKKARQEKAERVKEFRAKNALNKEVEKWLGDQLQNEEQLRLQINDRCMRFVQENKDLEMSLTVVKGDNIRLERMTDNLMWHAHYLHKGFIMMRGHKNFLKGFMLLVFLSGQLGMYLYFLGFV